MITQRLSTKVAAVVVLAFGIGSCGGQQFPDSQSTASKNPASSTPASSTPASGGTSTSTPAARLLAATQRTTQAKTARLAIGVSISGLGAAGAVTFTGAGAIDLAGKRMEMTLGGTAADSTISFEMRVVGGTVYIRNDGGPWTSTSVNVTGATTPVATDILAYLRGISGGVRVEGRETLRGAITTRYGATIDLDRAQVGGDAAQQATIRHALAEFGVAKFPATVWIDDLGRLRKMELSIDLGNIAARLGAPAGTRPKIDESIEMFDFGTPVDIAVPEVTTPEPASTVAPTPALASTADLRNALTAELVVYTDGQTFTADPARLKQIEPNLDWGGTLTVVVGSSSAGSNDIVCLSEPSAGGVSSLAYVGRGPRAGTYYGHRACPAHLSEALVSASGTRG